MLITCPHCQSSISPPTPPSPPAGGGGGVPPAAAKPRAPAGIRAGVRLGFGAFIVMPILLITLVIAVSWIVKDVIAPAVAGTFTPAQLRSSAAPQTYPPAARRL